MSGTFPSSPAPRSIQVRSLQPARVSVGHSLKRYTRTLNAQRWLLSLDFTSLERADLAPIWAFLVGQRGQYDTFQYVLPNPIHTPRGTATGSPVVNGNFGSPAEAQTGRTVYTRSWTAGITALKAGDFLKFASHSKVYIAREDVTADGSGLATIPIEPALVQAVSDADALTTSSIPFTVSLTQDGAGFNLGVGSIFELERVELIEAL